MFTILVVEDDAPLQRMMSACLGLNGFSVVGAANGEEALNAIDKVMPDLVIADVMMPVMDGWELTRELRRCYPRLPIMLVTARDTIEDKRTGFTSGADDYLTKPFSVIELVSRVKAVLRRCQPEGDSSVLRSGEVSLDTRAHTVLSGGERVDLTYKEYELLRLFLSHPGTAYTRDRLMELVWGMDYCGESRTVDMHIRTLRQKLGKAGAHITTVRGVGYRWEETI